MNSWISPICALFRAPQQTLDASKALNQQRSAEPVFLNKFRMLRRAL
jgi:hypothetical protein